MPLVIKSGKIAEAVSPTPFAAEDQLQVLLASHPNLLRHDSEPPLALVAREVNLNEAGYLDLLMINRDGLPIAVEVKLERNSEARREVVAQAIDYISTLSTKTVDELDEMVGGQIEGVLRAFDEQVDDEAFERRWRALGANLRAGLVRLLVAVDAATPGLERILRFLAEKSELDVQLIVIQRFIGSNSEEVLVARPTFSAESVSKSSTLSAREVRAELLAAVKYYNANADTGFGAVGAATYYRQIRPQGWPTGSRTHYEFYQTNSYLGAELHIESDAARPLSATLVAFDGKPVLGGKKQLMWDQAWSSGRGRLAIRFTPADNPADIAQAMKELIAITYPAVTERLGELFGPKP